MILPELVLAFQKFSTGKSLDRFIMGKEFYVPPLEIKMGNIGDQGKKATFQYVPILKTLEAMLKNDDVLGQVLHPMPSNEGYIQTFRDF